MCFISFTVCPLSVCKAVLLHLMENLKIRCLHCWFSDITLQQPWLINTEQRNCPRRPISGLRDNNCTPLLTSSVHEAFTSMGLVQLNKAGRKRRPVRVWEGWFTKKLEASNTEATSYFSLASMTHVSDVSRDALASYRFSLCGSGGLFWTQQQCEALKIYSSSEVLRQKNPRLSYSVGVLVFNHFTSFKSL